MFEINKNNLGKLTAVSISIIRPLNYLIFLKNVFFIKLTRNN